MARRNLNFTLGYVRQWGLWEALRELLQNWADQRDNSEDDRDTVEFSVRNGHDVGTVVLKNHGVTLTPDTLTLGGTSKADGGSRGKYGEGMKLSWAVLYRLGIERANLDFSKYLHKLSVLSGERAATVEAMRTLKREGDSHSVRYAKEELEALDAKLDSLSKAIDEAIAIKVYIRNGGERWIPYIDIAEGMTVPTLHVDARKLPGDNDECIEVRVEGITRAEWEDIQSRCLFLQKPKTIDLSDGQVLTDPEYAGKIFVKGLYVCATPEKSRWGYNFNNMEITRDRGVTDPWTVRAIVNRMIEEMAAREAQQDEDDDNDALSDLFADISDEETLESTSVRHYSAYSDTDRREAVQVSMKARFVKEHGADAFPVESGNQADADVVKECGHRPVFVSRGMAEALKGEYSIAKLRDSKDILEVIKDYKTLPEPERANIFWLASVFSDVRDNQIGGRFRVVRFSGIGVMGDSSRGFFDLSVKALASREATIKGVAQAFSTSTRTPVNVLTDIIVQMAKQNDVSNIQPIDPDDIDEAPETLVAPDGYDIPDSAVIMTPASDYPF